MKGAHYTIPGRNQKRNTREPVENGQHNNINSLFSFILFMLLLNCCFLLNLTSFMRVF